MRQPDLEAELALEAAFGHARVSRYVKPFYLKLMGCNAANASEDLIAKVRERSRRLSAKDIGQLLQMPWRPRVMGAWYAIAAQDASLSAAVHDSLETCLGHLTSPPLITATLAYPNAGTTSLLRDYIEMDRRMGWGAAGFASGALTRLEPGNENGSDAASAFRADDIELIDKLAAFGDALRSK